MSILLIVLLAVIAFLAVCAFFAAGNSHASSSDDIPVPPPPPPAPRHRSPSLFFETDWIGKRNHRHDAAMERHRAASRSSNDHDFLL